MSSTRRRSAVVVAWVVTVLAAAGAGAWAATAAFLPPEVEESEVAAPTYTVTEEAVGRTMSFPVAVEWPVRNTATLAGEGTVTSVDVADGDRVRAGDELFALDLRPVIVMTGDVPAFRDLARGTEGDDVRQLQEFLRDTGYLAVAEPGGVFGPLTTSAVRAWQRDAGFPVDGTVRASDVLFTPDLPARVRFGEEVGVGARLAPGTDALAVLAPHPDLAIKLMAEQASLVPTDRPVRVLAEDHVWDAVVDESTVTEEGMLILALTGPDGGSVCGKQCRDLPVAGGERLVSGEIVVVPDESGPAVPAAAVMTRPDGGTYVVLDDGTEVDVSVAAQGDGRAVVEGLDVGATVRLFGDAE